MAVVREVLEVHQFEKLKILTGTGGLGNHVGTVTVMEVPEITQFLRGDDFLITSLYSIGNDVKKQCELVEDLVKTKSACLAIKLGKYADKLSDEMLAIADRNNFPIILIPPDMTYIHIIMNVMNIILTEKNIEGIMEKFIQDIIFETYVDEKIMVERGRILNIDVKNHVFQTIVIQPSKAEQLDDHKRKMLRFMSRQLTEYISAVKGVSSCSLMLLETHAVLLLEGEQAEILDGCTAVLRSELLKRIKSGFAQSPWKLGVGAVDEGLSGIRKSYGTALKVIQTGSALKPREDIYIYHDLEIYCQLSETLMQNPISFYQKVFDKIDSNDLIITLESYFDNECSMELTARQLFTHKNTIKYRINKIKELTGLDVKKQEDKFKIYLMLLEKKLKNG